VIPPAQSSVVKSRMPDSQPPIDRRRSETPRIKRAGPIDLRLVCSMLLIGVISSGCSTSRASFTAGQQAIAAVPDIPHARAWADDGNGLFESPAFRPVAGPHQPIRILALSGGGAEGAFGAGVLVGMSRSGNRPQFTVVTGSSIGGLIAPYAFLGSAYDAALQRVFTGGELENLFKIDGLNGIFGSAVFKNEPLRNLVFRHVDENLLRAIAGEHRRGRRLYVVTSNIDAQRTVIWNMGAIAASDALGRLDLFRKILVATVAVPGMWSPEYIEVRARGERFQEMHVDGGVTSNVLAVPEAVLLKSIERRSGPPSQLYVIVNGKLAPDFAMIENKTLSIVTRSFFTTVKSNTRNTLIATYAFARRNGWQYNMTAIPQNHKISTTSIDFDAKYMRGLFALGLEHGVNPRLWSHQVGGSESMLTAHKLVRANNN
jgi:hypothetical protein